MTTAQTYTGPKRGFVLCPHGNIEYREMGSGPPLILLHNTPYSSGLYHDALPFLKDHVRAIAMSTMGYGPSDTPPYPYTTVTEYAQCVIWLMDGLGIEKANVFGNATGSVIAVEVAVSWPERVDKLIISECFNWNTPARRAVLERQSPYFPDTLDGSHLLAMWERAGGTRPENDPSSSKMRQTLLNQFRVNHMDNGGDEVYGATGWWGAGPYAISRYEMWEATPRIKAPTLVIHGENSNLGHAHEKFLQTIPRSKGVRIPDGENFMFNKEAEAWAGILVDFLKDPGL